MTLPVFPEMPIKWKSKKTPVFSTYVKVAGSGRRKSMTHQSYPDWEIECSLTGLTDEQIRRVAGFLLSVQGRLSPFLWKDPEDYRETNVLLGYGNGVNRNFQLVRRWGALNPEPVRDVVAGTLHVFCDGQEQDAYDFDDGLITLAMAPASGAAVTATFEYYWRVAMDADDVGWSVEFFDINEIDSFKVVTVR